MVARTGEHAYPAPKSEDAHRYSKQFLGTCVSCGQVSPATAKVVALEAAIAKVEK